MGDAQKHIREAINHLREAKRENSVTIEVELEDDLIIELFQYCCAEDITPGELVARAVESLTDSLEEDA